MLDFLICLIISVLLGYGIAILLVEKGKDFPVRRYRILLQKFIHDHIGRKWSRVLKCVTCTSFWGALVADMAVGIIAFLSGGFYFFWPFSGIIAAGFTFTIIEYLNSIDKDPNINVFVDKGDYDEN